MDSRKQSGLSIQEKNHRQREKSMEEEDETGVGRTYECAFCKHGFTNAQALGGHMNIHRKDKAKAAKQKNREEVPLSRVRSRNELFSNLMQNPLQSVPQLDQNEKHQLNYYMSEGRQVKYKVYLPPSNPNFQSGNFRANLQTLRPERHIDGYDRGNLSLETGSRAYVKGINDDGNAKENEVDLELRLGPDPTRYGDY